jgi:hypothetical protein
MSSNEDKVRSFAEMLDAAAFAAAAFAAAAAAAAAAQRSRLRGRIISAKLLR